MNRKDASTQYSFLLQTNISAHITDDQNQIGCKMVCTRQKNPARTELSHIYSITFFSDQIDKTKNSGENNPAYHISKSIPAPLHAINARLQKNSTNSQLNLAMPKNEAPINNIDNFYIGYQWGKKYESMKEIPEPVSFENYNDNIYNLENSLYKVFNGDHLTINDFKLNTPGLHMLVEILIRKNRNACKSR